LGNTWESMSSPDSLKASTHVGAFLFKKLTPGNPDASGVGF
jgi:hypothetical protein